MPKMTPPESGVKIRLYRKFLGDCLLLAFPTDQDGEAYYMMIDCGAFLSDPLEEVAKDIAESTEGEIDVVVMTHEHQDHLSGFGFSKPRKIFQDKTKINFHELWMAWTEGKSKLARDLQDDVKKGLAALHDTAMAMQGSGLAIGKEMSDEILDLMETSFAKTVDAARKNLLKLVPNPKKNHHTWDPGQWCEPLGEGGMRVYFFGPPKDLDLLRTNEVSGEHYDPKRFAIESAFHSAAMAYASLGEQVDHARPFGKEKHLDEDAAKEHSFFLKYYFGSRKRRLDKDEVPFGASWRNIDLDWLQQASNLALQYDGYINNTSLVMAIELPETGKVILLPGDAQGGNWLSWSDENQESLPTFNVDGEEVRSVDLLRRTVFYKVGHHGSHNGTLRAGLEQLGTDLPDEPLVAMIPTDEMYAWLSKTAGRWRMPYLPLYKRLLELTEGRVVQGDFGLPDMKERNTDPHPNPRFNGEMAYSDTLWDEVSSLALSFQSNIDDLRSQSDIYREEDLYFEYTILDE